jgi:DNA processing protein
VDETIDLLALTLIGVTPRRIRELREQGLVKAVLQSPNELEGVLGDGALSGLDPEVRRPAEVEVGRASALGFRIVGLDDPDYPEALRRTFDPPAVLYVWGRLAQSPEPLARVAVVGSRQASRTGRAFARALSADLASLGIEVISGLARGIDGEAHRGALDARGRTIAVLGSALDSVYPHEHRGLAREIAREGGAVVSEFPLGTGPKPHHFPRRNRILAGLAQAVVVVEAAERSGALSTARLAADEGREVLAVPGHPTEAKCAGTNALLRDGAGLVRSAADVAEVLGLVIPVTPEGRPSGDHILDSLRRDRPMPLEELHSLCGLETSELLSRLSILEIEARVRRLPGPAYVRA